jgi:hypothetical protein
MSNCGSKKSKKGDKYKDGGMVSPRKAMAMGYNMGGTVDVKRAQLFAQNLGQSMQDPMVARKPKGMM